MTTRPPSCLRPFVWLAVLMLVGVGGGFWLTGQRDKAQAPSATKQVTNDRKPEMPGTSAKPAATASNRPVKFTKAKPATLQDIDLRSRQQAAEPSPERLQVLERMKREVRGLAVGFDPVSGAPSYVQATGRFLTGPAPANAKARDVVAAFIDGHSGLFGHDASALKSARVSREDVTAHNGLTTLVWNQEVNGIPVFKTILKASVTKNGELVTMGDHFVSQPVANQTAPTLSAAQSVAQAAASLNDAVDAAKVTTTTSASGAERFQRCQAPGQSDTTTQLTYFPMDATRVRLGWDVTTFSLANNEMFRIVVDAETGEVLYRASLTSDLSDASYRVFTTESPTPLSPGHEFRSNLQPAEVSRTMVKTPALDTFASPNGWINDGQMETNGNNVDAHTDTNANNSADLPRPNGGAERVFDFSLDLTQAPSTYKDASVTQLFYWCNYMHDRLYPLGFTESAGNFQVNNFGRGGSGNDPVQADAQDGSGTNNANFSTPTDGSSGRMQMYLWTGPTPDRDGSFEAEVVLHEYGHGVSNRLVGGGVGISALASRGMGEGWSDFLGMALTADASENPHGNWARGGYSRYRISSWYSENYYFGGRRYSYSSDMLKNPHTLKDIDPTKVDWHTSVPRNPTFAATDDATEVHYTGTVWCAMLWDLRTNLILRHGFAIGNDRAMQLVLDGMKLSPVNPNFLQARDAIVQAAVVSFPEDLGEVWTAFAKRGAGKDAVAPASTTTTGITESYLVPDDLQIDDRSGWSIIGDKGGPFTPATKVITLANYGTGSVSWSVDTGVPWLSAAPLSGTIPAGGYAAVTVTTQADSVVPGFYGTNVVFTNTATRFNQPLGVRLYVMPPRVHYFDMTTDPGWTHTGEWDYGTPTGGGGTTAGGSGNADPTSGATGSKVFGVNLAGNHASTVGGPYYLTMGPVSLATSSKTRLRFQRWLNTSSATSMRTAVEVSTDGTTWREVFANGGTAITDNAWTRMDYDISSIADHQATVYVRWLYQVLSSTSYSGWNIDDVELLGEADNVLTITSAGTATEGGSAVVALVSVGVPVASDMTVNLVSSDTTAATVPATVIIPAGQTLTTFTITPVNDTIADGPQATVITASATGFGPGRENFIVNDNETATLTLSGFTSVSETSTNVTGIVTRSVASASPVTVTLASSNPLAATVPASVVISAGFTLASFPITPVNDTLIDGTQTTTITASVTGWTSAARTLTVTDNESPTLTVVAPATVTEGSSGTGSVTIPGKLASSLVVNLSSNQSKLLVPAWVTIPAGATSVSFKATAPNDALAELNTTATITASATGFTSGTGNTTVTDNDVHHFTFSTISSPKVPGGAFSITVTARNASNTTATGFVGTATLTATGTPDPVTLSLTTTGAFTSGVWAGSVTVNGALATSVKLTADDGLGHTGTSTAFNLAIGAADHFVISPISDGMVGVPITTTISAVDSGGNTVTTYSGTAALSVLSGGAVGTGTSSTTTLPLGSVFHDERAQCIYLQSELGGAAKIRGLTLNVVTVPGQTLNNWTIRLKHTSLSSYTTPAWDGTGWTTVYQSNETISSTGPRTFTFTTPFDYNGVSNLMVDFSFNNSSFTSSGSVRYTASSTPRAIYYRTDSGYGNPLTWSGTSNPTPITTTSLPNLVLVPDQVAAVTPTQTGSFSQGVWTGDVVISQPFTQVALQATDGVRSGTSNDFTVDSPVIADNQDVSVRYNSSEIIQLTGRDTVSPSETLTFAVSSGPAHGILSGNGAALLYTPVADYSGSDSFTFTASNGTTNSLPATVSIQVAPKLGTDWILRNPLPTAEHLNAMAVSSSGRVVIVGEHGSIVSSDDLSVWTARTSGIAEHLYDVTWTGSEFVAVGDAGRVLTSADGFSWAIAVRPALDPLLAVAKGGSQSVAVGGKTTGIAFTSPDGLAWTRRVLPSSTPVKDIVWTGSQFVAITNSLALTSPDGVTWTRRSMPCSSPTSMSLLQSGVIVVSGNTVCTSSDGGVHWTTRTGPLNLRLSSTDTEVVGVSSDGRIYTTTAGIAWTLVQAAQGLELRASTRINDTFVVAGKNGTIQTGSPLATPTSVPMTLQPAGRLMAPSNAVTWNRSTTTPLYVAVGNGATWTSIDGTSWTPHAQAGKNMLSVTWTGTSFVAVGSAIWTSTDGITWTQRVAGFSTTAPSFYGVSYFNSKAYVTGYNAKTKAAIIGSSSAPDGYSWNSFTTLAGGNALISITKAGSKFVGVGWNGVVAVSSDGAHWSTVKVPLAAGDYFTDVTASAAGMFVATTYDGAIWTSTNGTSWTKRFYASHSLWCVTRTANEFLAAGNYGTLVHSFDGIYWREENLGTHIFINQIIETDSQLIATGGYGAIFTSSGTVPVRPTVNFALSSATLAENASPLTVSVTLSQAWSIPVTVPLSFVGTASTYDYTRSATSLTFAPGQMTRTFTITPKNDALKELSETIIITLGTATGDVATGSVRMMTVTLTDDDSAPAPPPAASLRITDGLASSWSEVSQPTAATLLATPVSPTATSIALHGLPDRFVGFAADIAMRIDLAVNEDGTCTGKLTRDDTATPFTGQFRVVDDALTSTVTIGEEVLTATLHLATGELTGTLAADGKSLPINGWKFPAP